MSRGVEYVNSAVRDRINDAAAALLNPVASYYFARLGKSILATDPTINPVYSEPRVGRNGQLFDVLKIRTLHPSDNATLINEDTRHARRTGLDELPQVWQIPKQLGVFGFRPLPKDHFDMIMDPDNVSAKKRQEFMKLVLPTKPGLISSFAIEGHENPQRSIEDPEAYVSLAIADVKYASLKKDLYMIRQLSALFLAGNMQDPLTDSPEVQ